jgi:hypothetical protein
LQERDVLRLALEGSRQHRDSVPRVAAQHCAVQFDYATKFPRTARHALVQYEMSVVLDAHVSITAVVVTLKAPARSRRKRARAQPIYEPFAVRTIERQWKLRFALMNAAAFALACCRSCVRAPCMPRGVGFAAFAVGKLCVYREAIAGTMLCA